MKKILIDAGHGGEDSGATAEHAIPSTCNNIHCPNRTNATTSCQNIVQEKDIALQVSLAAGNSLEHLMPNAEIYFTRIRDKKMALSKRCKAIMDINPDAFVSIHCNAIPDDPRTDRDEREIVHGTEIFYRDDNDLLLAQAIDRIFSRSTIWRNNRGIKQDQEWLNKRLAVLNNVEAPSVLVEIGFLSNEQERTTIIRYKNEIGDLIAHGIVDYLTGGRDV